MKKISITFAAFALAGSMMAQSNQLSIGADIGLPMGDFGDAASLLVGPSVGFELPISDNIGITLQAGYSLVILKDEVKAAIDSYSMIPVQAGLKYYFSENQHGLYGHAQVGIHNTTVKTADIDLGPFGTIAGQSNSNTNLSWAIGAGYMLEKLDIGVRYNSILPASDAPDGTNSSSYLGLRVAYLLNLGN